MTTVTDTQDDLRLPRQPGVIQQFWARHTSLADWLIAVFWGLPTTLATLVGLAHQASHSPLGLWGVIAGTLLVIGACAGIHLRRTRPILAFGILCIALIPAPFIDSPTEILPVFGVYSLAVYRSNGAAWIAAGALEVVSTLYALALKPFGAAQAFAQNPATWFTILGVQLLIALAIGATIGNRRRYLAALIDRARQLARERDQQAQLAAVAERARIARDMHDVVSHSLTVMVTLAEGSAAAAAADAERAAAVMRQVADTGREALAGMRQMLGLLGGDEPAEFAPQPTAADVPRLVARFRETGLPVALRVEGEVPPEPALQVAVYRIVQEALTNALRYSQGPTSVDVVIDAAGDPMAVVVEDDGLPGMPVASVGAGQGLIGVRERVTALGGTLAVGPRATGSGWRVAAALPLPAAPGATSAAASPRLDEGRTDERNETP